MLCPARRPGDLARRAWSEFEAGTNSVLVRLFDLGRQTLGGRELAPELLRLDRGGRPRALRDGEGRAHRAVLCIAQLKQTLGRLFGRAARALRTRPLRAEDRR